MADCESILRWLAEKSYRVVNENHPAWGIVNRLVDEGRAEWLCAAYRVRAKPLRPLADETTERK